MADEVDEIPTEFEEARKITQRFKRNNPLGRSIDKFVVYAICSLKEHVEEHFGTALWLNIVNRFPDGSNGIRVYKGTTWFFTRRYFLVFTVEDLTSTNPQIPEELTSKVYRIKNQSFDLDVIAKNPALVNNHLVCQPKCPQKASLFKS